MSPKERTANKNDANRELLREKIAYAHDLILYRQYTETQAASALEIHPATLKRVRLNGGIDFIRLGRRAIKYFGFQIADYLIGSISCQTTSSKSENSGSHNTREAQSGTAVGTIERENAPAALALARETLKPRSQN